MKNCLVSIIVLTYRNFDSIDSCLKSILNQTYKNIEVIISDDFSSNFEEKNFDLIQKTKNDNIKNLIIRRNINNLGTVKNFNNAINESKGKIIIPLSPDDEFYDKNVVENIVNFFVENNCMICTGRRLVIDNKGDEKKILPESDKISYFSGGSGKLLNGLFKAKFISGACTYYRRDIFEKYGMFDERFKLLEDYSFYLDIVSQGEMIKLLDFITIKYKLGGVSTSNSVNPILKDDFKKVYEYIIFDNRSRYKSNMYRDKRLEYYRLYFRENQKKYFFAHIIYFDRVLVRAIKRIRKKGLNVK